MVTGGTRVPLSAAELATLDPRARVVAIARAELDSTDWQKYQRDAAPCYPFGVRKLWCGIFALWCLRAAGLTQWLWVDRDGFVFGLGWRVAVPPQPGDVVVKHAPFAHHSIVEEVRGGTIHVIAGNTGTSPGVVARQSYSATSREITVYTIRPLVDAAISAGAPLPPAPNGTVGFVFSARLLLFGVEGDDVSEWQRFLKTWRYQETPVLSPAHGPGRFDGYTHAATVAFQLAQRIGVDGKVGPQTRTAARVVIAERA